MALQLRINTGSNLPIYRQIADQIRQAIATRVLKPGETLPSVRGLAEQLVINPNTVARAYSELAREGLVDSSQGLGFFVSERRQIYSLEERQRRLREAARAFANEVAFLDFNREQILKSVDQELGRITKPPRKNEGD
jgi:GntR family transcriptional regulator